VGSDIETRFIARVIIDDSCAASLAQAGNYTRVLLSVTDKYDEQTMEWAATQDGGTYYKVSYLVEWDEAGKPEGAKQYEIVFDYEVYR